MYARRVDNQRKSRRHRSTRREIVCGPRFFTCHVVVSREFGYNYSNRFRRRVTITQASGFNVSTAQCIEASFSARFDFATVHPLRRWDSPGGRAISAVSSVRCSASFDRVGSGHTQSRFEASCADWVHDDLSLSFAVASVGACEFRSSGSPAPRTDFL